jgi:hypothetical protein
VIISYLFVVVVVCEALAHLSWPYPRAHFEEVRQVEERAAQQAALARAVERCKLAFESKGLVKPYDTTCKSQGLMKTGSPYGSNWMQQLCSPPPCAWGPPRR